MYTARVQWLLLLQKVSDGEAILITRGGLPIAHLTAAVSLQSTKARFVCDPDTAQRVRLLTGQYQPPIMTMVLGISAERLEVLQENGLADDRLFRKLIALETLARIVFHGGATEMGRRWLMRPHRMLNHHPPVFVLRRSIIDDPTAYNMLLSLARSSFHRNHS